MDNFMDQYDTVEAFIRSEVLANRGRGNLIDKLDLIQMIKNCDPDTQHNYLQMSKSELFDLLVSIKGSEAYSMMPPVGVGSFAFQKKFGITHKDVLYMAQHGFIQVCGNKQFRNYGRTCYTNTYSPYDYFRLTREEVHEWLSQNCRNRKFTNI